MLVDEMCCCCIGFDEVVDGECCWMKEKESGREDYL
jgi:hypothetical protein